MVGAGSASGVLDNSQASNASPGSAAPPSMAHPAKQQCGNAPLCCCTSCARPPPASSVTTRGPLAVQMMVVAPGAVLGPANAAEAISAWKTNRNTATSAVQRLRATAPVCIRILLKWRMVARRVP